MPVVSPQVNCRTCCPWEFLLPAFWVLLISDDFNSGDNVSRVPLVSDDCGCGDKVPRPCLSPLSSLCGVAKSFVAVMQMMDAPVVSSPNKVAPDTGLTANCFWSNEGLNCICCTGVGFRPMTPPLRSLNHSPSLRFLHEILKRSSVIHFLCMKMAMSFYSWDNRQQNVLSCHMRNTQMLACTLAHNALSFHIWSTHSCLVRVIAFDLSMLLAMCCAIPLQSLPNS